MLEKLRTNGNITVIEYTFRCAKKRADLKLPFGKEYSSYFNLLIKS